MKKTAFLTFFVAITLILTSANFNQIPAQQSVEDQYWEAVKNSSNIEDFKSYLKEYPNGKYAAIARSKINPQRASSSFLSFKVSTSMTNIAFMERWENSMRTQLPIKYGQDEIYRANAPTSVENYFYLGVRTPNLFQVNIRSQAAQLKSTLLTDYCKSEAYQRKITVVLGYRDNTSSYSKALAPSDCSSNTSTTRQTDAQYLKTWAAQVRVDLPEMIGNFQLKDAWSRCPSGCKETDNSPYLLLYFNALNNQKNAPIARLKNSLMPLLLEEYCKSDAITRKINLGVFFDNRGPQADFNNFWVRPADCSKKTINGKIVFITSKAYDGNLGGVSGADAICQMHARNAGLSGTFKAWIGGRSSNRQASPLSTFNRSTLPYIMTNGNQIAGNWQALLTSNLENKFDFDEYGRQQLNAGTWTGLSEGRILQTCNNWTSNGSGQSGAHGCSSTKDSRWGRDNCGTDRCDSKRPIYCFQQ